MNPPLPRPPAALSAAVQRIKVTAREATQRCVDALGVAALASSSTSGREDLLAAQFELNRKQSAFAMVFNERLDDSVAAEMRRREGAPRSTTVGSSWQSLTLVDDREVEIQVSAERFAMTLQQTCEWELRELDALVAGLLHKPHTERTEGEVRNPLRPEVIGRAMVAACDAVSDRPSVRKAMAEQMARTLSDGDACAVRHDRAGTQGRRRQAPGDGRALGAGPWQRTRPVHQHRLRHDGSASGRRRAGQRGWPPGHPKRRQPLEHRQRQPRRRFARRHGGRLLEGRNDRSGRRRGHEPDPAPGHAGQHCGRYPDRCGAQRARLGSRHAGAFCPT